MRSVVDELRRQDQARISALSPEARVALAIRLAEQATEVLCAAQALSRPQAAALARRIRQRGRRPSRSASE